MKRNVVLGAAFAISQVLSTPVMAENNTINTNNMCFESTSSTIGQVVNPIGNVFSTSTNGLNQIQETTQLAVGSVFTTGSNGAATVFLSNDKSFDLPSNSKLSVTSSETVAGHICLNVESRIINASAGNGSYAQVFNNGAGAAPAVPPVPPNLSGLFFVGIAAGTFGVVEGLDEDDTPASN